MKGYKEYMDNRTVSPILHEKIMRRVTQKPIPGFKSRVISGYSIFKSRVILGYAAAAAFAVFLLFGLWAVPGLLSNGTADNGSNGFFGGEPNGYIVGTPAHSPEPPAPGPSHRPETLYALVFNDVQGEMSISRLPPDFMYGLTDEQFEAVFPTLDPLRFVADATYWVMLMEMTEVTAYDPNGRVLIRLAENHVTDTALVFNEDLHISYVHGVAVTAAVYRQHDFIEGEFTSLYAVRANFMLDHIAYSITDSDVDKDTAKARLTEIVNLIIAGGAADLSVVADPVVPELRNEAYTLEQARLDVDFGAFMPVNIPQGFTFDSARRTLNQWDNAIRANWHSFPTFDGIFWTVAEPRDYDLTRIVSVSDREKYDVSLYPIPWFDSVPEAIFEYFWDPVFLAEEMTLEVVMARAHREEGRRGTEPGWQIDNFSVLYGDVLVSISARGVSPEEIWDMLPKR
jgi:hypothetical protein